MKKTNQIVKTVIAVAVVTILVACKKDLGMISKTSTNYAGSSTLGDSATTKRALGYTGGTGTSDSTATKKAY